MRMLDTLKRTFYEEVRYEVERWPLWRWDQNLRYIAKSFAHRPTPLTEGDRAHHAAMRRYHAQLRWPKAGPSCQRWSAVGDLMWLRDGYSDFLADDLQAHFGRDDVIFANLETPVDPDVPVKRWVYETMRYNAPTSYLDAWRCAPDAHKVFSLCNNHALDQGLSGLRATRAQLDQRAGFEAVGGAGGRDDARCVFERDGLRVAVIATTFGVNGAPPAPVPEGVPVHAFGDPRAGTDWDAVRALIDAARADDPDWLVMLPHWGFEYEYWPDAAMRADAYRLIELGVDVVFGSSPHVLQPVEVLSVDGWDPRCPVQLERGGQARPAVVAFSLGNFASIIPTVACQTGCVLSMTLNRDTITDLRALPTVCMRGLGERWIEARALTVEGYGATPRAQRHPAATFHTHAEAILGPLIRDNLAHDQPHRSEETP